MAERVSIPSKSDEGGKGLVGQVTEKPYRTLAKTISWRITGSLDTLLISFLVITFFTKATGVDCPGGTGGTLGMAGMIAGIEVATKMVLYYFHERIWTKINFGRETTKPPEYEI